ncbi:hypothetical protein [Shewanella sp. UCD-KL21]|uniref:hypothetical protein n=1 Tax=Shewanella sp. UCD-KL21 TaxID=1917164 RepID=UPI0011158B7E|nr:hypothetical protein [Shewanella sp. UCD-KL21]
MLIIRFILFFAAFFIMLYPIWGLIEPTSYLNELIETFPFAKGASDAQVQKALIILLLPNAIISVALVLIAKFISTPSIYNFAYTAAILLMLFPIIQSVADIFIGSVLSQHLEGSSMAIELSSQKLFYFIFGLAIWAISKSQSDYKKQIMHDH